MQHKLKDIIKGLKYLYKKKMKLREASENLKSEGIDISHNAIRGWKQNASDILRVLINNIKAKKGDEDALIAVKSIRESTSWLKLDQIDKNVNVSFYTPKRIKKRIKRKRKRKIIEKHETGDVVRLDIKKPITIELNKKDELSNKVLMGLLSRSNEFTNPELANLFNIDVGIVNKDINKFKELGAVGLINISDLKKNNNKLKLEAHSMD